MKSKIVRFVSYNLIKSHKKIKLVESTDFLKKVSQCMGVEKSLLEPMKNIQFQQDVATSCIFAL